MTKDIIDAFVQAIQKQHPSEDVIDIVKKRSFTEEEAAEYIGVRLSFLKRSRLIEHLYRPYTLLPPHHIKLGMFIRYLREDWDEWLMKYGDQKTLGKKKRSGKK